MNQAYLNRFISLAKGSSIQGYTEEEARIKREFHTKGKRILRAIAEELGLQSGAYDIRSNLAGPAVCGEVTLHGERIYIQLTQSCLNGFDILYRACNGRKDYGGRGGNRWMSWNTLKNLNEACTIFKQVT